MRARTRTTPAAPPRRHLLAARVVALSVAGLVLAPAAAEAAAFDVNDTSWEGCSELLEVARKELGEARVYPVAILHWDELRPDDGVLVLHPTRELDPGEVVDFMKAGGRLAIVDDYGRGDATLRRFQIERVAAPARPAMALRSKAALAVAEPALEASGGQTLGPHPVVANVARLVTNHPTALKHPNLSPVLRVRTIGEGDAFVAVAGQVERGRLFAMSDPSALTNQMLRYPGNRAFAAGLARYLVDEEAQKRKRGRLFIVANGFGEQGSFGGETTAAQELEGHLRDMRDALSELRRTGLPGWSLVAVAALLALGLASWVKKSAASPYRNPMPRFAREVALVGQGGVAGRFALLAAPSSPRSLALMELKSALFETVAASQGLEGDPSPDAVRRAVESANGLDPQAASAFKEVFAMMQRVESALVAGRKARVTREGLEAAARVIEEVLEAFPVDGRALDPRLAGGGEPHPPAGPPAHGESQHAQGDDAR